MILLCGASGLLGCEMCKLLEMNKIDYIGTFNSNKINKNNMYKINFNDIEFIEKFIKEQNVKICIFFIAERRPDKCENNWNLVQNINIDLVNNISYICNKLNIKFIHLSSDYVFDGTKQPNYPDDLKNPLQIYGITKYLSELKVISNCKKFCIIRTPVLYSYNCKISDNAVTTIGKKAMNLSDGTKFIEDNYCIRRPLHCSDLCKFILDCILKDYNGIYHFYNPINKFTKFEILNLISKNISYNINVLPNNNKNEGLALRPYDTQLKDNKISIEEYKFENFENSINLIFSKFTHPKINIENCKNFFIMMDLDGTIVDSLDCHYNAYNKALNLYNKKNIDKEVWNEYVLNSNINKYLKDKYSHEEVLSIKNSKTEFLKDEELIFTKNCDKFIQFLVDNNVNFCIVTNSPNTTIEIFKNKLPLLKKVKNWVTRDEYTEPKPNPECYKHAIKKFHKTEKYVIGFEDSLVGYQSLKHLTNIIYVFNNKYVFEDNDCYLINNYDVLVDL